MRFKGRQIRMHRFCLSTVAAILWMAIACDRPLSQPPESQPPESQTVEVAFSFTHDEQGGIASVSVLPTSGKIREPVQIFASEACNEPLKVRRAANGTRVVTNLNKTGPHLFLVRPDDQQPPKSLVLDSIPDELRIIDGQAIVSCDGDALVAVDLDRQTVSQSIRLDELLTPPANDPEDVHIAEGRFAIVSFQKDSNKGKKKGSRLAIFELPELKLKADIQLPRDRTELHIDGNLKQQGPGPEVIHVSTSTDTLATTLDLYGAVGMFNWSDALENQLIGWHSVSTSTTGDWGDAFPDRVSAINLNGRDCLLVCNAGAEGGTVLVDLTRRAIAWKRETPPGLEAPIYFESLGKAYSVCSGKVKRRVDDDVVKTFEPQSKIYALDFSSPKPSIAPVVLYDLPIFTVQLMAVSHNPPLLLIAGGTDPNEPKELLTFDPVAERITDRRVTEMLIKRFER